MKIPTLHLNGSAPRNLLDPLEEAATALSAALQALEATSPNDRDYYVQGPEAGAQARREWRARVVAVGSVLIEVERLRDAVQRQIDGR